MLVSDATEIIGTREEHYWVFQFQLAYHTQIDRSCKLCANLFSEINRKTNSVEYFLEKIRELVPQESVEHSDLGLS